jgi:hypothetical protein
MTLYARSDMVSIVIPATSGGCGSVHSRPVKSGAPVRTWGLECPPCEAYLRGDRKAKIIRVIPGDKEQGIPSRMEHVADADPQWSTTPEGIPPTPDEQHVNKIRAERGAEQLQQLQALAMLQGAGFKLPDEAQWLLDKNFDARIVRGTVVCPDGHDNTSGAQFCATCGIRMATKAFLAPAEPVTADSDSGESPPDAESLRIFHVATLKKMCREKGLPDKGNKEILIKRLTVPATVKLTSEVAA